ncbi:hypothetical protein [Achromobacter mucicolens]|uniref:hypothetical protein n=1 Tax=Achromobacter mucicolens TaxID=1389922 RepID=UPI00289CA94D|nr:hypothetical protein [Achromobacter mucicolens]
MQKAKLILDDLAFSQLVFDINKYSDGLDCLVAAVESANCEIIDVLGIKDEEFYLLESGGRNVSEELFSDRNAEFRDLVLRLQMMISRWSALPEANGDHRGEGVGISLLKGDGYGALLALTKPESSDWWDDSTMHIVSQSGDLPIALRKHFLEAKIEEKYFPTFCSEMFPDLYFHETPDKLKNLRVSYPEHVRSIVGYFSYLNDFALVHFDADEDRAIIAMAGSKGVSISPESPKTRQNGRAMEERDIEINGEILRCEWHAKVTATCGRIHFYARRGRPENVRIKIGEKVVVGIMVDHLTT